MTFQQGTQGTTGQQMRGQQTSGGQQMSGGQHSSSTHQMGGQQMGLTRQEGLSTTQQQTLAAITDAMEACAWCADQCIQMADPSMIQCIQYCEDVQELGEAAHVLLARNSQHSMSALATLQQAMQACAEECRNHAHGHCQDCAETLTQAVQSISQLTGRGQTQQTMGSMQGSQWM